MKLTIGKVELKFSLFSIVLYLLLVVLLLSLGFWQLGRAEQKEVLLRQQNSSSQVAVLKLTKGIDLNTTRYRKATITGHYDSAKQYLIDNQILNGRVGYYVMTPFMVDGLKVAVLVNRGWILLNKDRRVLPELTIDSSELTITGRINHFPVVGIKLAGAEIPTEGWPSVVQVVDSKVLSKKLGYELLPFQIELDKNMSHGYERDWKKKQFMPPEKHVAYAVQWFGLALTLTVLFIGFSRKSR